MSNPINPDLSNYPRTYRASPVWLTICLLSGILFIVLGATSCWFIVTDNSLPNPTGGKIVGYGFLLFFVSVGIYAIADTLTLKIILYPDAIERRKLLSCRRLERDEIAGIRRQRNGVGLTIVLVPLNSARKKLKFPQILKTEAVFQDWFASLHDLDERDRQQAENDTKQSEVRIAEDLRFGATPQARRIRLARARTVARYLNIAGFLAILWGFFPRPYELAILSIAVLPWIGVALVLTSGGLYRIAGGASHAAHPVVGFLFVFPGVALFLRALLDVNAVDWKGPFVIALVGGLALAFLLPLIDRRRRNSPWKTALGLALFTTAYAHGGLLLGNWLLDRTRPEIFRAVVLDKHLIDGKKTTYELRLGRWGPFPAENKANVSRELYETVNRGWFVCATLGQGALGIPWYTVTKCY